MSHLILTLACIATLALPVRQNPDILADLAKAEALWKAQKPQSYELTVQIVCPGLCAAHPEAPASFRVTDGQPLPIGDVGFNPYFSSYNTVENLFGVVRTRAGTKPGRMKVVYDDKLGYPITIYWNNHPTITESDWTVQITGFKILRKGPLTP